MFRIFFLMSGAGAGAETGPSIFQSFIFIILIFAIFYFLMIRPQQKKQKEHQQMIASLRKGDRVVTNGGIYGVISDVKDHVVVLKISENVKIELVKNAIAAVIEKRQD